MAFIWNDVNPNKLKVSKKLRDHTVVVQTDTGLIGPIFINSSIKICLQILRKSAIVNLRRAAALGPALIKAIEMGFLIRSALAFAFKVKRGLIPTFIAY